MAPDNSLPFPLIPLFRPPPYEAMFCGLLGQVPRLLKTIYGLVKRPNPRSPNPENHVEEIYPSRGRDEMAALWGDALDEYRKITGDDFRDPNSKFHALYLRLEACSNEDELLGVLGSETQALETYRHGSEWSSRLRSSLLPIANCVLAVIEVGGEAAAATKAPGGKALFVVVAILLKAAINVSEALQALIELLETFASYVTCLKIDKDTRLPIEPGLREIIVQTLVEMLRTLAYAVQTMGRGRWVQFLRNLAGQGNEVLERTRRAENLMERDVRFRVTSVHGMMKTLTAVSIPRVLHALESLRDEVSDQGQRITRFTNRQEVRSTFLRVLSEVQIRRLRRDVTSMTRQIEQLVSTPLTDAAPNTVTIRIQFPDLNFARLSRMAGGLLGLVRLLSGVEQASLRGSIATLSDGTTTNIRSDDTEDTTTVSLTGSMSAGTVLDAVHAIAVGVFTAFTRWTYIWPFQQGINRNPDHVHIDSIILIDAVGREMELRLDMSWNDVHMALLERFRGRAGWSYVDSNSYNLFVPESSSEQVSFIEPDAWGQTIQAGLTVEMSIVVRQLSTAVQCPYCDLSTSQTSMNARVICSGCGRSYVASETHAHIEEVDMDTVDTVQPSIETTPPDPPRSSAPVFPISSSSGPASPPLRNPDISEVTSTSIGSSTPVINNHEETPFAATSDQHKPREPDDLNLFRSVTVLHSHTVPVIDDLRMWLDPPNPTPINYDAKRRAGSCEWFFDDSFEDWKARKGSMYWVLGHAGAGKSIICSSVVDTLQKDPKLLLAYFYFDEGDPKKQDHRGLVSSLVFQIGTGSERGVDYLKGQRSPHSPPYDKLLPLLSRLLSRSGPTVIVIDALDKCPERAREGLLHLLGYLRSLRSDDDINLRVLVTSRPETDIQDCMSSLATHTLNVNIAREHLQDIHDYLSTQLFDPTSKSFSQWDERIKWRVYDDLSDRSNGMFLWVVLQLQDLKHCAVNDVERALDELPSDLDGTYERILKCFPSKPAMITRVRHVFECVAFARESLSAAAVAEILSVDFDSALPYVASTSPVQTEDPETVILRTCPRLLEIVSDYEGRKTVQFIHRSFEEYLTSPTLRQATSSPAHPYSIDKSSAPLTLAKICLTALDVDGALPSVQGYADRHWYDHVLSSNYDTLGKLLDSFLDMRSPSFVRWEGRTHHTMNTAFHWAASLGFYRRVEGMLERSRHGSSAPADTLVRVRDVHGRTALHVAAGQGHAEVCRLLLEHGALVEDADHDGNIPLHDAAYEGNLDVVRLLLEHPAANGSNAAALRCRIRDKQGRTALHYAVYCVNSEVCRLLLEHGALVDDEDNNGWTPLQLAKKGRDGNTEEVVRVLLEYGAIDVSDADAL